MTRILLCALLAFVTVLAGGAGVFAQDPTSAQQVDVVITVRKPDGSALERAPIILLSQANVRFAFTDDEGNGGSVGRRMSGAGAPRCRVCCVKRHLTLSLKPHAPQDLQIRRGEDVEGRAGECRAVVGDGGGRVGRVRGTEGRSEE